MNANEQSISKEEALVQVRLALRRAALIYHYFAKTLIDELGEDRGRELILKAVNAYGEHIGKASRRRAQEKGLALSPQNYQEDLPKMAWEAEPVTVDGEDRTRVHHCPLAAEWLACIALSIRPRWRLLTRNSNTFTSRTCWMAIHTAKWLSGRLRGSLMMIERIGILYLYDSK